MNDSFPGQIGIFTLCLILVIPFFISPALSLYPQDEVKSSDDSIQATWTKPFGGTKPSPAQLIQLRALQHPFRIQTEMSLGNHTPVASPFADFSQMFHDFDQDIFDYPGIEYRHGSNYIPQNVRDYTEFKMGRDRYLPILNPVLIGFILYNVSKYANYYFGDRDTESILQSLDRQQREMLLILQENYPLNLDGWYKSYQVRFPDNTFTKSAFNEKVKELDNLSLVKTRVFEEDEVKYYPAFNKESGKDEKSIQLKK